MPLPDYKFEIEKLEKEIAKFEKKETKFIPVTEKPPDFEPDFFKATDGKLSSIQNLIKIENVEVKDGYKRTTLIIASEKGYLDIVKYLVE